MNLVLSKIADLDRSAKVREVRKSTPPPQKKNSKIADLDRLAKVRKSWSRPERYVETTSAPPPPPGRVPSRLKGDQYNGYSCFISMHADRVSFVD